jgi:hypothetical protein
VGVGHCDAGHNVTKLSAFTAKALSELEFIPTRLWLYLEGMTGNYQLPRKFAMMAPWAKKTRLLGVRDQADQTLKHRVAQVNMVKRTGRLVNINSSPEVMTARLLLDWETRESPRDMGAHWLELGYIDQQ